jgi:hypothetical protein
VIFEFSEVVKGQAAVLLDKSFQERLKNTRKLMAGFAAEVGFTSASSGCPKLASGDATDRTNVAVTATKLGTGSGPLGVRSYPWLRWSSSFCFD